jgi:hypothetical protein
MLEKFEKFQNIKKVIKASTLVKANLKNVVNSNHKSSTKFFQKTVEDQKAKAAIKA